MSPCFVIIICNDLSNLNVSVTRPPHSSSLGKELPATFRVAELAKGGLLEVKWRLGCMERTPLTWEEWSVGCYEDSDKKGLGGGGNCWNKDYEKIREERRKAEQKAKDDLKAKEEAEREQFRVAARAEAEKQVWSNSGTSSL